MADVHRAQILDDPRRSVGREKLADRLAHRQQSAVSEVAQRRRIGPREEKRIGRRQRAVDHHALRTTQQEPVVRESPRRRKPVRPVIERQIGRQADRNLVLQKLPGGARIAEDHEFDAARVAFGLAEVAFAENFRAHFRPAGAVLARAQHDDPARVTAGKLQDGLELRERVFGRRGQPEVQDKVDLRSLGVRRRGRGTFGGRGLVPERGESLGDRAHRHLDSGQCFEDPGHGA
jgi:hypothetical protein